MKSSSPQVTRRPLEDCGPGVWYDMKTGRIHARLGHTNLAHLGDQNYRGETDPRKLPLVIAVGLKWAQILNKSSKAFLALFDPAAGVDPVSRSTLTLGANNVHSFRASFGLMRAGIFSRHSNGAPESNDWQWMQA